MPGSWARASSKGCSTWHSTHQEAKTLTTGGRAAGERVQEEPRQQGENQERKGRPEAPEGKLARHLSHGRRLRGGFPALLASGFAGALAERRLMPLRSRS